MQGAKNAYNSTPKKVNRHEKSYPIWGSELTMRSTETKQQRITKYKEMKLYLTVKYHVTQQRHKLQVKFLKSMRILQIHSLMRNGKPIEDIDYKKVIRQAIAEVIREQRKQQE